MVQGKLVQIRDKTLEAVLASLFQRMANLERRSSIRIGGIGGAIGGNGYTLTIDASGNLVAVSDSGTTTILASQ